jgi:hypothetical protein
MESRFNISLLIQEPLCTPLDLRFAGVQTLFCHLRRHFPPVLLWGRVNGTAGDVMGDASICVEVEPGDTLLLAGLAHDVGVDDLLKNHETPRIDGGSPNGCF